MPKFKNGTHVNYPYGDGRIRISAGPHRGKYVDTMILEAKLGRPLRRGYTVEHDDGNTLNVHWKNLLEVTNAENVRRMHKRRNKNDGAD